MLASVSRASHTMPNLGDGLEEDKGDVDPTQTTALNSQSDWLIFVNHVGCHCLIKMVAIEVIIMVNNNG